MQTLIVTHTQLVVLLVELFLRLRERQRRPLQVLDPHVRQPGDVAAALPQFPLGESEIKWETDGRSTGCKVQFESCQEDITWVKN